MAENVFKPRPRVVATSATTRTSWEIGLLQIAATLIAAAMAIYFGSIRTEPRETYSGNLARNEGEVVRVTDNRPVAIPSPTLAPGLPRPRGDKRFRSKSPSARAPSTLELPIDSGPGLPGIIRECSYTDLQLRQCPAPTAPNSAKSKFPKKGVT